MKRPTAFLVFFGFFWSAITLTFDVVCVHGLLGQWRSRSFVSVPAVILSSEVTTDSGGDGTTYGAKVRYRYVVGRDTHESERVRFGQGSDSDGRWARRVARDFPAGSTRTAYYDPADPAEAVLQTGVGGQDLFLALFLTPFNVVMVMLWGGLVMNWRAVPPAGGARITTLPDRLLVKFNLVTPAVAALVALAGSTFVGIFIVGFSQGFSPSLALVNTVWLACIVATIAAAFHWRKRVATGAPDLVINATDGTLTLVAPAPATVTHWPAWRTARKNPPPPAVVPLEQIRGVAVRERITNTGDGSSTSYVPVLLVQAARAAEVRELDLGSWMLPRRAEAFAAWLRETLSLPPAS